MLTPARVLVRHRAHGVLSVRVEPVRTGSRVLRADPAAVVSAVHAWLGAATGPPPTPASLVCEVGPLAVRVRMMAATEDDLGYEL
uniref:hypothetical protein n=1 Tax=Streptomyces corallincola TaxID=2851888 RepID=UPI0027E2ECB2|nr:hypothetical protein [Streptomyces corallincola]